MPKVKVENLIFTIVLIGIVVAGFLPKYIQGKVEVLSLAIGTAILLFVKSFSLFNYHHSFKQVLVFCILLVFFVYLSFTTGQYKPVFFLFFLFFLFYNDKSRIRLPEGGLKFLLFFLLFLSTILLFVSSRYSLGEQSRFLGFSISPTVFAVVVEAIMILGLLTFKTKQHRILIIICTLLFVVLSKTRLNLILFLFIPFIPLIERRSKSFRFVVLVIFSLALILIYPLYDLLLQTGVFSEFLGLRYHDGRDASFGLRNSLFFLGVNIISESSSLQFLFGHGAEFSRLAIIEVYNKDLKIHNDFIVILIDYGLVFTLYFLFKIIQIGARNTYSFLAVILYFISFYHNMVLSIFLLLIIYYTSSSADDQKMKLPNGNISLE